jgi:hypothetical protein
MDSGDREREKTGKLGNNFHCRNPPALRHPEDPILTPSDRLRNGITHVHRNKIADIPSLEGTQLPG